MEISAQIVFLISALAVVTGKVPTIQEVAKELNARVMRGVNTLGRVAPTETEDSGTPEATPSCKPEDMTCKNNELTICGIGNVQVTLPCSSLFDGRSGYCDCDNTQCLPNPPVCSDPDSLKCETPGEKMPDPSDCRQFTYCDETKVKATLRCPEGMVYNPSNRACESSIPCRRLTCNARKVVEWIPFPQAPEYYLFCMRGAGEVRRCTQEGYTMQNNKCQFSCKQEGLFKDPLPENCNKGMWHTCIRRGSQFRRETQYCPKIGDQQKYFDEKDGVCKTVSSCSSDNKLPPSEDGTK